MGLVYVGNCDYEESTEFVMGLDEFGVDTLTRTFEGRTDKLQAFLAKYPKGKKDPTFQQFTRRTIQATGRGAFTSVTITFAGLMSGKLPPPQITGGWRLQTASIKRLDSEETVEIEYRAPVTTYRYVSRTQPTQQRYERQLVQTALAWQFKQIRGDRTTRFHEVREIGRAGGIVIYTETKSLYFNYTRDIQTSEFSFEPVGNVWEVIEQNEGLIVEPLRNDLPRHLYPDHFAALAEAQAAATT